jgi:hypothetical protein
MARRSAHALQACFEAMDGAPMALAGVRGACKAQKSPDFYTLAF